MSRQNRLQPLPIRIKCDKGFRHFSQRPESPSPHFKRLRILRFSPPVADSTGRESLYDGRQRKRYRLNLSFRFVWLDDATVYLSVTARGDMQLDDFKEVVQAIHLALGSTESNTLVDLRKARWDLSAIESNAVVAAFSENRLNMKDKIALVCGRDIDHYGQLLVIASASFNQGYRVRAFYRMDLALEWLSGKPC